MLFRTSRLVGYVMVPCKSTQKSPLETTFFGGSWVLDFFPKNLRILCLILTASVGCDISGQRGDDWITGNDGGIRDGGDAGLVVHSRLGVDMWFIRKMLFVIFCWTNWLKTIRCIQYWTAKCFFFKWHLLVPTFILDFNVTYNMHLLVRKWCTWLWNGNNEPYLKWLNNGFSSRSFVDTLSGSWTSSLFIYYK